jgi:hypothetical protein
VLVGFVGGRHLTIEYDYTVQRARELFGVDLKDCARYTEDGQPIRQHRRRDFDEGREHDRDQGKRPRARLEALRQAVRPRLLCRRRLPKFLKNRRRPTCSSRFWPVYALTFNEAESEDELFPPSDVSN